ncbi:MAG: RDD family protein, partial [Chloroflexi bacterium]
EIGKAALRGFIWVLEVGFTICIIGAIGWLWQLWDPQRQAIHDKVAGTIVTIN